jgi:hypothetical protein
MATGRPRLSSCAAPGGRCGSVDVARRAQRALGFVGLLALVGTTAGPACGEAAEPPPTGPVIVGSDGRQRFIVTLAGATPDLGEYRALLKSDPTAATAYVEAKRAALARPDVENALGAFRGRVVERWWMSNQLTVEMEREGLATLRAVNGVTAVEPDVLLQ